MPRRPIVAVPSIAASKLSAASLCLRQLEHRLARLGERHARVLLVAGQHDRDAPALECAGRVQRLQRLQHDDRPALHVGRPGAVGARAVAAEALAGQHRVEVAEQQQPLAAACRRSPRRGARPASSPAGNSTQRVRKPMARSSAAKASPTARTPATFSVGLSMSTTRCKQRLRRGLAFRGVARDRALACGRGRRARRSRRRAAGTGMRSRYG